MSDKCKVCGRLAVTLERLREPFPDEHDASKCFANVYSGHWHKVDCYRLGYERLSRELESVRTQPAPRSGT